MVANVLTDLFIEDFIENESGFSSFKIEVNNNSVTVDRKHQQTSLIESKTIKVDKDVLVYIHEIGEDVVDLECKWLWRDSTVFEKLSYEQALELQRTITQISNTNREAALKNVHLTGIRVGSQIWSATNLNIDVGIESSIPKSDDKVLKQLGMLYTYSGAERIESLHPGWKIPTIKDYQILFNFFRSDKWNELTGHMDFKLAGFYSKKIKEKEMRTFLEMNAALKPHYGGFYWTRDFVDIQPGNSKTGKRSYIYFNSFNKEITEEQSINANDNYFSLRLIKKT